MTRLAMERRVICYCQYSSLSTRTILGDDISPVMASSSPHDLPTWKPAIVSSRRDPTTGTVGTSIRSGGSDYYALRMDECSTHHRDHDMTNSVGPQRSLQRAEFLSFDEEGYVRIDESLLPCYAVVVKASKWQGSISVC